MSPSALEAPAAPRELDRLMNKFTREAWRLRKRDREARCQLWSHEFRFELRLMVGELRRSQVCRSSDEVLDHAESWKAAMMERGWHEA